jgi:hypothetical protein
LISRKGGEKKRRIRAEEVERTWSGAGGRNFLQAWKMEEWSRRPEILE